MIALPDPAAVSRVTAPAFLLGSVAAFASILATRMDRIIERTRALNAIPPDDPARGHLRADIARLERRAALVNRAIMLAVSSAVATACLLLVAFLCAFFGLPHEFGLGALFAVALVLLMAALITLAMDVRIALTAFDHEQ